MALIELLVAEKLQAVAEEVGKEGWKWIETAVSFPYGANHGMRELIGETSLREEEQQQLATLQTEYDELEQLYQDADELPPAVDQRLGEIEAAIAAFKSRPMIYDPAERARVGVFISIDSSGQLLLDRGYVRPEDEVSMDVEGTEGEPVPNTDFLTDHLKVVRVGGDITETVEEDDSAIRPLPDRLISELSAHRTLALRDALARNPQIALTALLHKLVSYTFLHRRSSGCLEVMIKHVTFPVQADDLKDSACAKAILEGYNSWKAELPGDDGDLWHWLHNLDQSSRMALLAHCISYGVNAFYQRADNYGSGAVTAYTIRQRLDDADHLARALELDMVEAGWRPTSDNYLGRVTKGRILEAVREARGEDAAQLIAHLKKGDMAREAERLLVDSGWLPEPLRLNLGDEKASAINAQNDDPALPAFLMTGDEAISADIEAAPLENVA